MNKKWIAMAFVLIFALLAGCAPKDDPAPPADADIEAIALTLVTSMSGGDYEGAADDYAYTGQMRRVISEKFLRVQVWEYLVANYGAFEGFGESAVSQVDEYRNVEIPANFENGVINMRITFDAEKLIAGIHSIPVEQ